MKLSLDAVRGAAKAAVNRTDTDAEEAEGIARFLRGLTLGALVGAAIAGSAIWRRARNRSEPTTDELSRRDHPTGDVDRL